MLPDDFPKWQTVHSYFRQWKEIPEDGGPSMLERALKKSGRRGPPPTGTPALDELPRRRRPKREECRLRRTKGG